MNTISTFLADRDAGRKGMSTYLILRGLESNYHGKKLLNGIDIEIWPGEIVVVTGPPGSGKSTLLKTIFGLIPTLAGHIVFGNTTITNSTPARNVARGIAYHSQRLDLSEELTVREHLMYGDFILPNQNQRQRMRQVLQHFPELESREEVPASELNSLNRQLLSLARVLMTSPRLILIDEPASGLSAWEANLFATRVERFNRFHGISMLIVTRHEQYFMAGADWLYRVENGRVVHKGKALEPDE